MPLETLPALLQAAAGNQTAVLLPEADARLTYEELRAQVESMAAALSGAGLGPTDRIAMALPNGLAMLVSFLGASMAGTAAPLNPGYREEEFRFYLEDIQARALLVPPEGAEAARRAAPGGVKVLTVVTEGRSVRLEPSCAPGPVRAPDPGAIALILHTSGSTGRPKRVPIPHAKLAISAGNVARTYALSESDVSLCVMPLFHVHGLVASTLATLLTGGTVVLPARFQPLSFWKLLRDSGATWYSAVPTIHQLALARAGGERPGGLERLRFVRSCSAPLAVALAASMERLLEVPVIEAYGMTEAAHQMASNPLPPAERRAGTVGPGTGVRIAIMDKGRLLADGQRGEVVIQGPNVVAGYENDPQANAESFVAGWFRTGDQGLLEEGGYLRLTGRIKELINRGGEKISPVEIDEVLLGHPQVAEAVAFGMPHAAWGEEVAAAVVLREESTEASILAYCRERLADFKCPKKLFVLDAIPRTATGKIQRRTVAESVLGSR